LGLLQIFYQNKLFLGVPILHYKNPLQTPASYAASQLCSQPASKPFTPNNPRNRHHLFLPLPLFLPPQQQTAKNKL
jgi:hypothetical protein